MPAYKNIVGQKFGMLTVLEELPGYKVLCMCDCGNLNIVAKNKVVNGLTKSCGCRRVEKIDCNDIVGRTFGRLTVLSCEGRMGDKYLYTCKCACGKIVKGIGRGNLIGKATQSCGCLKSDNNVRVTDSQSNNLYSERKGLTYNKKLNRWYARLTYKNVNYYLGSSRNCEEAEEMRNRADEEVKKYGRVITYVSCRPNKGGRA